MSIENGVWLDPRAANEIKQEWPDIGQTLRFESFIGFDEDLSTVAKRFKLDESYIPEFFDFYLGRAAVNELAAAQLSFALGLTTTPARTARAAEQEAREMAQDYRRRAEQLLDYLPPSMWNRILSGSMEG